MSQNSITINDGTGAQVLQSINGALDTLATLHSGPTAPGAPQAGMLWVDTSVTPSRLKIRNSANTAWTDLGSIDQTGLHTAAELLAKIKTVDGAGSGLDADMVDGLQASQFMRTDIDTNNAGQLSSNRLKVNNGGHLTIGSNDVTTDSSGVRLHYVRSANQIRAYPLDATGLAENSPISLGIYYNGVYKDVWHDGISPASFATNGYQKLPNGLIIQWGQYTKASGSTQETFSFPIAFPTACFAVYSSRTNVAYAYAGAVFIDSFTTTSFVASNASSSAASGTFWMFAIGY